MSLKKIQAAILTVALTGCIGLYIFFNTRSLGLCNPSCGSYVEEYQNIFLFFGVLLPMILITYVSNSSFIYWWRFAKYAAPICFALVVAINFGVLHTTSYGTFGVGDMLNQAYDMWALGLVYTVFVVGSVIQIARGYFAKPAV